MADSPRQPVKPSHPLGYIAFGKDGTVSQPVIENLPPTKDELEAAIASKFADRLRARGRILGPVSRGGDHDFVTTEGRSHIELELVEVVDPEIAARRARYRQYFEAFSRDVEELLSQVRGIRLNIDPYDESVLWPPIQTLAGKRIRTDLVAAFSRLVPDLTARGVGRAIVVHLHDSFGQSLARLGGFRFASQQSPEPAILTQHLSFSTTEGRLAELLPIAINKKRRRAYARSANVALWLVAYAFDHETVAIQMPESVARVQELLSSGDHPFCEVWTFVPMAEPLLGDARQIWAA